MNPQQFNRYSYVLNNALRFTDPTGHVCYDPSAGAAAGQCYSQDGDHVNPQHIIEKRRASLEPPSNLLTHLPLGPDDITWQSGFGPNWYATSHGDCPCYPQSHNIHTGLDFGGAAGSTVYATVSGKIVEEYVRDGNPNVVIEVTVGGIKYYVVHGHVEIKDGMMGKEVKAGDIIGVLEDQGSNSHVHLGLRLDYNIQNRAYNPLLFMDPALTVGMDFVSETRPYYGNETPTSIRSFLYGTGSYYDKANRGSIGIVR